MSSVRVLLVEDEGMSAAMGSAEISEAMACETTRAADPLEALARMDRDRFDVVVADMLYLAHSEEFQTRRRQGLVRLTDARLHLSGLSVLQAAHGAGIPAVLWTNGEPNRRLHMMFAYEQLGCRLMCPKDTVGKLAEAVQAAADARTYIDPLLRMYLPPPSSPSLAETFFSPTRLAIWRAMALGLHEHARIADVVGVRPGTVRRGVEETRTKLVAFDPGCSLDGPPTPELVRYAGQNWHFFLDHTVRELHP